MRIRYKSLSIFTIWIKGEADIMKLAIVFPRLNFSFLQSTHIYYVGKDLAQYKAQRCAPWTLYLPCSHICPVG